MKKDVLFLLSHAEVYVVEEVGFFGFFRCCFEGLFLSCVLLREEPEELFSL